MSKSHAEEIIGVLWLIVAFMFLPYGTKLGYNLDSVGFCLAIIKFGIATYASIKYAINRQ